MKNSLLEVMSSSLTTYLGSSATQAICASWQSRYGIHQIVIRTLSGFCYLCQQPAYLVISRIFLIASQVDESLESYQDYSAKLEGKQGGEFLIAALVKS
jgi:hypothetical protein